MNIEVADTIVATVVAAAATRKMAGSRAEPDPVPLLDGGEDIKMGPPEKRCGNVQRPFLNNDLASSGRTEVVPGLMGEKKIKVELERAAPPVLSASPTDTRGLQYRPAHEFPIYRFRGKRS